MTSMNRSEILNKDIEISVDEIKWCFISDYYDGPIEGLLYYKNKIWKFCCFKEDVPDQEIYVILRLSDQELADEIKSKLRFEEMVGTHFSYDEKGQRLPDSNANQKTQQEYFKNKAESKIFTPYTHEIEVWFNVAAIKAS
jgi:uncharacterized beta-barrel protein YwiB (DUF1934 family)